MPADVPTAARQAPESAPAQWTVGTLSYNRKQLGGLILWLLWGDFTLTLMLSVMPQLLPLSLKEIGASNTLIAFVIGSLPTAMNLVLVPTFSTASDRYRGRWGRSIPFLVWPTPFIAFFLILIGFSPDLGSWLYGTTAGRALGLDAKALILILVCVFVVLYQFFNLSVTSVYYYLFADVVPAPVMGRFLGLFRIVGQAALFLWGRYIFGMAADHMRAIYVGIGLLYMVSFLLMCWGVKEGEYPPPPPRREGHHGLTGWLKTYFNECFHTRYYLWIYLIVTVCWFANAANTLWIFFCRDTLGLTLDAIGKINAWGTLATIPLALVFGWLVDKINGLRLSFLGVLIMGLGAAAGFFWVQGPRSLLIYYLVYQVGFLAYITAMMPMYITLFPKERFGQFCSANSMISSLGIVLGNAACGWFVDRIGDYRYLLAWQAVFFLATIIPLVMAYRGWRKYGGPDNYRPPQVGDTVAVINTKDSCKTKR
jgi:MFS family permease